MPSASSKKPVDKKAAKTQEEVPCLSDESPGDALPFTSCLTTSGRGWALLAEFLDEASVSDGSLSVSSDTDKLWTTRFRIVYNDK